MNLLEKKISLEHGSDESEKERDPNDNIHGWNCGVCEKQNLEVALWSDPGR